MSRIAHVYVHDSVTLGDLLDALQFTDIAVTQMPLTGVYVLRKAPRDVERDLTAHEDYLPAMVRRQAD